MTKPTKRIDQIVAGTYRTKLLRGGPKVGVRFWQDGGQWFVMVNGRTHRVDGALIDPDEVWPYAEPISEDEFAFMERRRCWAEQHDPDHPAANPSRAIDLGKMKPRY